ncbi:CMRF35-like molecule 6, partial [Apodemus sylvaticus]|uniref:CMRF35-like molecule 6 n=1 Tax=Apodemus sylvaticus TaxID=10129 RepID=UPI002243467A
MAWEATYLLSSVLLLPLASGNPFPTAAGNGLSPMNYVSPLYWANGPEMFRTLEGKTVSVECSYDPRYNSSGKIWCKRKSEGICQSPVWSDSTGAKKLRFSIQHSSGFNSFTVTMTELKMSDSGTYHCGILGNSGNFTSLRS